MQKIKILLLFLVLISCGKKIKVKNALGISALDIARIQAATCTVDSVSSLGGQVYFDPSTSKYFTNDYSITIDVTCNESKVNKVWYRVGDNSSPWILADGISGDWSMFSLNRGISDPSRLCVRSGTASEELGAVSCYDIEVDQSAPSLAFVGPTTPDSNILISALGEQSGVASLSCSLSRHQYDMVEVIFEDVDCTSMSVNVPSESGYGYMLTVVAIDNVANESAPTTYSWGVAAQTVVPTCNITGIRGAFPQDGKEVLRSSYDSANKSFYFNNTEVYAQVECSDLPSGLQYTLNGVEGDSVDVSQQSKFEFLTSIQNQSELCIRPWKDMSFGDDVCYQFYPNTLPPSGAYPKICYDDWKKSVFSLEDYSNPAISTSTASPQSDGFDNLKKFAFAGNPHVNQSGNFSQMYFNGSATFSSNVAGKTYGYAQNINVSATPKTGDVFFFVRPNSCLKYEFQGTADLVNWTTIASYDGATGVTVGTMSVVVTPVNDSISKVMMTNLSLGAGASSFFRFKITQN